MIIFVITTLPCILLPATFPIPPDPILSSQCYQGGLTYVCVCVRVCVCVHLIRPTKLLSVTWSHALTTGPVCAAAHARKKSFGQEDSLLGRKGEKFPLPGILLDLAFHPLAANHRRSPTHCFSACSRSSLKLDLIEKLALLSFNPLLPKRYFCTSI